MLTVALHLLFEVTVSDRGRRKLTDRERARIREQYRVAHVDPGIDTVIDNGQVPDEALAALLKAIGQKSVDGAR